MSEGPRYNPTDFEEFVLEEARAHASPANGNGSAPVVVGPLELRADAEPPLKPFLELMDSPKFRATFERRRKDMQDQSPSAYDMALVSAAVRAGWSDQHTANLVIFGRKEHVGDVEKALRQDYMALMLRKVRQGIEQDQAAEVLEDRLAQQKTEGGDEEKVPRDELLLLVRRALQINITHIAKYGEETPDFELFTDMGRVKLGKVEGMIKHAHLRNAIAASCGRYIRDFTAPRWKAIAQALLDLSDPEGTGEESTDSGILRTWLADYLARKTPAEINEDALLAREPVTDRGRTLVFLDSLKTWLFLKRGERVSAKWLATEMRRLGSKPVVLNCELQGKRTTRETWPVPNPSAEAGEPGEAAG